MPDEPVRDLRKKLKTNPQTNMKIMLIALITATTLGSTAMNADAGCYRPVRSYCAPYRTSTCEIRQRSYCETAYDRCGNRYRFNVTVVTYRDYFSDGSSRTYTRSYRS